MTTEQQDLIWACLPKEMRLGIVQLYVEFQAESKGDYINRPFWVSIIRKFESIFREHNLTSDTEPEEMLMTPRKKVLEYYKDVQQAIGEENGDTRIEMEGRKWAMLYFFGDKCQPDNPNTPNSGELKSQEADNKPRFKVGDKVRIIIEGWQRDPISEVIYYDEGDNTYKLDALDCEEGGLWVKEWQIEPYTEPETKPLRVGNKVKVKGEDKVREIFRILPDGRIMFGDKGNTYSAENLELVEPETKDNTQQNSWDEDFKKMNECFEKIQKTLSSLCDTFCKLEANVNKLNRL